MVTSTRQAPSGDTSFTVRRNFERYQRGGRNLLRVDQVTDALEASVKLNALTREAAAEALLRCSGSTRFVESMLARRPFASRRAVFVARAEVWAELGPADFREAFTHHPEIGANLDELRQKFAATAAWSETEQAATAGASDATLLALQRGNQAYHARFGYTFIVCASGKSAVEMCALLEARLDNPPDVELTVAAAELAKITDLRLEKLGP
jgi:2-oxo-4-hydroxy-4-carboxy-5-ureidoimidazoline decarboxylase